MKDNSKLLAAAVAGLMGLGAVASIAQDSMSTKPSKKKADKNALVHCYGVNKCKTMGKCGGPGHECAGQNSCKGQGWLPMPKDSCEAIEGGTTTPPAAPASSDKKQ
jgi:uncharacterized membrane protein